RRADLMPPFQPDGSPSDTKFCAVLEDVLTRGMNLRVEWLYCRDDGDLLLMEAALLRIEIEGVPHVLIFLNDVRDTRKSRINERISRQRLQAMVDYCPIACGMIDEHFNVIEVNNEILNLFDITSKQTFTERFFEFSPEYQPDGQLSRRKALDKLTQAFEAGRIRYEWLHQRLFGEQIPCEVTLVSVQFEDTRAAVVYINDLRETKDSIAMVERMQTIAFTDELTQLHNRRYFMQNAIAKLEVCKANSEPFHLIMADLDHFKGVNDTYGHQIGDEVLKITAKRIVGVTRKSNLVARYGGEEFIIMLADMDYEAALSNARRIQKAMEDAPVVIKGMSLGLTVSLGIATLESPSDSLDDIIHRADVALYGAKRTGRNKVMEYKDAKDLNW
ncbi:MAG: GGDEF domain-containing protein, partial [Defluviitaleaceae bacterium]|nr:GGDEF domain-containing protein [Defluviitaleaceae bacterium]